MIRYQIACGMIVILIITIINWIDDEIKLKKLVKDKLGEYYK